MPQTKESFLKSRSTQVLIKAKRGKHGYISDNLVQLMDKFYTFTYSEQKFLQELNKRPHISHKKDRKSPHKFPNTRKSKKEPKLKPNK